MGRLERRSRALRHWKEFLPEKFKELQATGMLEAETNAAANMATDEIISLMQQGYQEHEAREVALPNYILLKPEPEDENDEQALELAQMEADYQKMMAEPPDEDE
ncbi:hypothetical protein [Bradyrhizobium sp. JYMT SZCCT0428]|uniref:hypothetical protein n=1 Tax=Bradyrhizobium sp. JYMT SZCCT0428 TaxID=2807673 RepID=UPI001BA6BB57|nr:hypothetical protein [Bradyrhizobium sp. JYMT SZCCT0428]MBR1156280.1 hypothetical protein [Bradyrhizobium sp. JYMT SZCCT0428]